MRDAGRDITSLIVDSITKHCGPLDLRNAALVCKEWRSMLGYAPAVASTLRGNDASAISKMVRTEGADSAVQHHITDFIRVLERAEATDSEDYNRRLQHDWRPMDDHLPATTVELGLIWMCAFRLSWDDHAQQMIDAWLSVIAGGVRDVNGNMDIELDAIDFIGPRDPDLYWFIPERTDFPCMRDTVRRISDVLLPRLGEIIDRAMKMGNDIAEYDRRVPLSSRAALEAEGVLDDTCRAVRRDCDFLMAYSLVIHAVFHEFPREASVHVRSLLPLPRMKSIYTYRTIPDHADDPDHLPYVFMCSYSSIAHGGVAEVIAEAIMGLGNLVQDGNDEPDGLRDFFSDQMDLDELRVARSLDDRIDVRDRKAKVVRSLPKVAASDLSWLIPLSDPDGYAGGLPGFAAFDQYAIQEVQFDCLFLLCALLDTNVHFDGTLIMDILVRLVAVNYDANFFAQSRPDCHPLSLVNKLACRQLADLKPHAQVIVDALGSLDPLVFDEAITAFGFLGDQAEPHMDHFLERTMMNTKRQETRDRVVQSLYEHRHRLNDHHLRMIALGLMLCDITIVVTSLEVVRVLCKAEENDEHRIRIMFQMFQNMALFASIICRGASSDGFRSPPIPPPTTATHHLLLNGGSYLLEAMQYVFSRFPKELQDGQVENLDNFSRDWQSRIDFGYAEKESLEVSQERYYRITNLHLRVMFEKDVSPELAMDHMLEMFDNQADRAKIEAYKVARTEAFSRGRQELRNRLSQFPELAEEYDSLLSSDDEEDTLNGDDGNSDASEDIENSPALD